MKMDFDKLNLKELDRNLSEDEKKEWNAIYASYRAGSLLGGKIIGVDTYSVSVMNPEIGKFEKRKVECLVVIAFRVKILIPASEIWYSEKESRPLHVLRTMTGAIIDYVITGIDRVGECCIASRRKAMQIRRRFFLKLIPRQGKKVRCDIIAVGKGRLLISYGGFDVTLATRDVSYAMIPDLRERYHPGQEKEAVVKDFDTETAVLKLSIKEAQPHPFTGVEERHPMYCRRASVITGKYSGGVFCRLEDDLDCLCIYSPAQYDDDFHIGDKVIVAITKYNYEKKLVYGRIVSKW